MYIVGRKEKRKGGMGRRQGGREGGREGGGLALHMLGVVTCVVPF